MERSQRPDLSICPFRPKDQTQAKALILEGLKEHWGSIDPQRNPDLDDILASYAGGFFLVAALGDRIVATGALIPRAARVAEIVRMSVAIDQRRRGIGSAVLRRLLEDAKTAGYQKIILETTSTWDESIAFYQKHGFRFTHLRGGDTFFALDLSPLDASA
jgi:ribosomal protein S18 acetylase RimI-like enzyme